MKETISNLFHLLAVAISAVITKETISNLFHLLAVAISVIITKETISNLFHLLAVAISVIITKETISNLFHLLAVAILWCQRAVTPPLVVPLSRERCRGSLPWRCVLLNLAECLENNNNKSRRMGKQTICIGEKQRCRSASQ